MRPGRTILTLALGWISIFGIGRAQSAPSFDEVGHFYMQNFAPEDYGADIQNWDLAQDPRGFLYVANTTGVLEFDGVSWRLIPVSSQSVTRSLAVGPEGRIFVGAVAEFGYLAPDSNGRLHYVSLLDHVPEADRQFLDVWKIHVTSAGVYFQSLERLFRWHSGRLDVWRPQESFQNAMAVHDTLYVTEGAGDLWTVDPDGVLGPVPGGESFRGQRTYAMVPDGAGAFLAVTRNHGLMRCRVGGDPKDFCTTYAPELTDLLARLEPSCVVRLPGGILALGTRASGLILIDQQGRLLRILDESMGLRSQSIWAAHVDHQGGLWLALNDGLARVEISAPVSYFDGTLGLSGFFQDIVRHHGRLHVTTDRGVSVLHSAPSVRTPDELDSGVPWPRFVPVPGIEDWCTTLLSTDEDLLVGCDGGLYSLGQGQKIWGLPNQSVFSIHRSVADPRQLYLGLAAGIARATLQAGTWGHVEVFETIRDQGRKIVEDASGRLWIGTLEGVLMLDVGASPSAPGASQRFGQDQGLPAGPVETTIVDGQVKVLSLIEASIFRPEPPDAPSRFIPDNTFFPHGAQVVTRLKEDASGRVWLTTGEGAFIAHPSADGGYTVMPTALGREPGLNPIKVVTEPGAVWVPTPKRLLRLDTNVPVESPAGSPVWIRRITTGDSVLHEGPHSGLGEAPVWSHAENALRFTFATPSFDALESTQYRTRLDGFEGAWSDWSDETNKDYTNLWEGEYTFRVQARDVYGVVSREDTFAFRILPPWHRTWWAYGLYVLGLGLVAQIWLRKHRRELQREREVAARERAINIKLREVDRLKNEFLANTSHELRTPLYGITGLAESLVDGAAGDLPELAVHNLTMIARSGRRLTSLVGDLLDFSRLQHMGVKLELRPVDLHALTDVVLAVCKPLAEAKGLILHNRVDPELPLALADERRVQQVLLNLVANAIKFTEEGAVKVRAESVDEGLIVRVVDTGIGIPAGQEERIFEVFQQADGANERTHGGTGLGLAISRQLVELHGGKIWAKSISAGARGAILSFTLPLAEGEAPGVPSPEDLPEESQSLPVPPVFTPDDSEEVTEVGLGAASEGAMILTVDDEAVVRQVLLNHLVAHGYRVRQASSGAEALQILGDEGAGIELVLLDVMMPQMSGYAVCHEIRQVHPLEELPVLFLSAKTSEVDRATALREGANDYLEKPISKRELLLRVGMHLELAEAHRRQRHEVERLQGLLPICSSCKKIRDDQGYWEDIEVYISERSEVDFSHGICIECAEALYRGIGLDSEVDELRNRADSVE